jgi:hypothetical protein
MGSVVFRIKRTDLQCLSAEAASPLDYPGIHPTSPIRVTTKGVPMDVVPGRAIRLYTPESLWPCIAR